MDFAQCPTLENNPWDFPGALRAPIAGNSDKT
jgi:hypothetical protein